MERRQTQVTIRATQTDVAIRPRSGRGARHRTCPLTQTACFGRARLSAFHRSSRRGAAAAPAQLQAMLPGTRILAGVTRRRLSQSREGTSRTGRSTGVNDARSRPGAVCETAPRHRARCRNQDRIRNAPFRREHAYVTEIRTYVNINVTGQRRDSKSIRARNSFRTAAAPAWIDRA